MQTDQEDDYIDFEEAWYKCILSPFLKKMWTISNHELLTYIPRCYFDEKHYCTFEMKCSMKDFRCVECFKTIQTKLFMVCVICQLHYHEDCWRTRFRAIYTNQYDTKIDLDIKTYYQYIDRNISKRLQENEDSKGKVISYDLEEYHSDSSSED